MIVIASEANPEPHEQTERVHTENKTQKEEERKKSIPRILSANIFSAHSRMTRISHSFNWSLCLILFCVWWHTMDTESFTRCCYRLAFCMACVPHSTMFRTSKRNHISMSCVPTKRMQVANNWSASLTEANAKHWWPQQPKTTTNTESGWQCKTVQQNAASAKQANGKLKIIEWLCVDAEIRSTNLPIQ